MGVVHLNQRGCTIWLTGLSGSGKSTIATQLEQLLFSHAITNIVLDGDILRQGLCADLGFSSHDRKENIRRVAEVAKLLSSRGIFSIVSLISPYAFDRELARSLHEKSNLLFVECFVDAPLSICQKRDPKGLYAKALAGQLSHFTGMDDPYENPTHPELQLKTDQLTAQACASQIMEYLRKAHFFEDMI